MSTKNLILLYNNGMSYINIDRYVGIGSTNKNYNYVRKAFKFQIITKLKTY